MGTIFEEYRRRHQVKSLNPLTEGVLFFNRDGAPSLICLLSSMAKGEKTCRHCLPPNTTTFELLLKENFPECYSLILHHHISNDADVIHEVQRQFPFHVVPYKSGGEADQQHWLWEFFISCRPRGGNLGKACDVMFARPDRCTDTNLTWIEDMLWLATHSHDLWSRFYSLYSLCCINRKYLLST